ncbi:hypothetical protein Acr_03g0010940 [Actinidia rufa]|uniref:Alpha/beta-Hydrolases superfamily protein n=1 Tax=Actinidia rufa TaxID=165716 RepID=A0A7J0ED58_9ERIC|nr:hypothetical protein Acr_03g0010940 [Actinidia rufa]
MQRRIYPKMPERQTSVAAWLGARLLLLYARLRIKNIMKNLYPSRVERADDWIINQMIRAGMKDPLPNSRPILAMLREHCKGLTVRELDAGHCPHDELPEEVNSIIQEWVFTERVELANPSNLRSHPQIWQHPIPDYLSIVACSLYVPCAL